MLERGLGKAQVVGDRVGVAVVTAGAPSSGRHGLSRAVDAVELPGDLFDIDVLVVAGTVRVRGPFGVGGRSFV
jgi:hypothetical protein